ncbi:Ankyrin-1 (ANK-1) (Ankyrin-R) (Erythrocyte ankyrin) [Durusdinium trenchii]|uniref:Ankyrin-1 (ANK-1) (Ankyrin-R) (Erythrocyte ankyrin) n=1 Tax=Durusdinium trenchii TaxID=1381693 RepID=A0ABP0QN37_9DINO
MIRVFKISGEEVATVAVESLAETPFGDTVKGLKYHLKPLMGVPIYQLKLVSQGQLLGSNVSLLGLGPGPMDLFVITSKVRPPNNGEFVRLCSAAQGGCVSQLEALLEIPIDPNHIDFLEDAAAEWSGGEEDLASPLYYATSEGHLKAVEILLEAGASVNRPDDFPDTPLYVAAECGFYELVEVLLHAKARTDGLGDCQTPLWIASSKGNSKVVELLLEAGADKNTNLTGDTPMCTAAKNGHLEVVQMLLEAGADKELPNILGEPPLFAACEKGHVDIVKLLLAEGAEQKVNLEGESPLFIAAHGGHVEVAKQLLQTSGEDLGDIRRSAQIASECGHWEIVKLLEGCPVPNQSE